MLPMPPSPHFEYSPEAGVEWVPAMEHFRHGALTCVVHLQFVLGLLLGELAAPQVPQDGGPVCKGEGVGIVVYSYSSLHCVAVGVSESYRELHGVVYY